MIMATISRSRSACEDTHAPYIAEALTVIAGTGLLLVLIDYLLLATVKAVPGRYVGLRFIARTNAAVIPFIALRIATVTGATSSAIATGGVIAIANIAGAVAPFLFTAKTAPHYYPGLWTLFAMLGATMVIVCYLWWKLGSSSEHRGPKGEVQFFDQPQMSEALQAAEDGWIQKDLPIDAPVRSGYKRSDCEC